MYFNFSFKNKLKKYMPTVNFYIFILKPYILYHYIVLNTNIQVKTHSKYFITQYFTDCNKNYSFIR